MHTYLCHLFVRHIHGCVGMHHSNSQRIWRWWCWSYWWRKREESASESCDKCVRLLKVLRVGTEMLTAFLLAETDRIIWMCDDTVLRIGGPWECGMRHKFNENWRILHISFSSFFPLPFPLSSSSFLPPPLSPTLFHSCSLSHPQSRRKLGLSNLVVNLVNVFYWWRKPGRIWSGLKLASVWGMYCSCMIYLS